MGADVVTVVALVVFAWGLMSARLGRATAPGWGGQTRRITVTTLPSTTASRPLIGSYAAAPQSTVTTSSAPWSFRVRKAAADGP